MPITAAAPNLPLDEIVVAAILLYRQPERAISEPACKQALQFIRKHQNHVLTVDLLKHRSTKRIPQSTFFFPAIFMNVEIYAFHARLRLGVGANTQLLPIVVHILGTLVKFTTFPILSASASISKIHTYCHLCSQLVMYRMSNFSIFRLTRIKAQPFAAAIFHESWEALLSSFCLISIPLCFGT